MHLIRPLRKEVKTLRIRIDLTKTDEKYTVWQFILMSLKMPDLYFIEQLNLMPEEPASKLRLKQAGDIFYQWLS